MKNISNRNYFLLFLDTVLYTNAMAFLSINAVIPYFLNKLGASTIEISLASVLVSVCALITQPLFSGMVLKLKYKLKPFVKILFTQRIIFLIFVMFIPIISKISPTLMIVMFLIFWGMFNLFVGSYSPFYNLIMSKLVPLNKRGRLLGFAGAFGNFIAIATSMLIGILLKNVSYPYNYTIIFLLGIVVLLLDVLDFNLMKDDVPDKVADKEINYVEYLKLLPNILKNNNKFAHMVAGFTFCTVTNVSLAFYTLYAIRTYHAGATEIAVFTSITVLVNIFASMILGVIADKFGHKYVLQVSALCGLGAGIIVISIAGIGSVYFAFILTTFCTCGYNLSSNMLVIQEAPRDELAMYISANMLITQIISSIALLLSGYVIDKFSFKPIFLLTIITGTAAYLMFRIFDKK